MQSTFNKWVTSAREVNFCSYYLARNFYSSLFSLFISVPLYSLYTGWYTVIGGVVGIDAIKLYRGLERARFLISVSEIFKFNFHF